MRMSSLPVNEGWRDVMSGWKDALRHSVGAPVGQNRGALYQFTGELVQNAINDLAAAIAAETVNPDLVDEPGLEPADVPKEPGPVETPPAATSPAATTAKSTKVAPGSAAVPTDAQKQTTQNINNYIRSVAASLNAETDPNKKLALTKELVNFMADRKGYPEWQNAFSTVKSIITKHSPRGRMSGSGSGSGKNMVTALQTGTRVAEAWQVYFINKLIESVGFTWKDLGLVLLKESKTKKYVIAESRFYNLNTIFESIMREDPAASAGESISSYVLRWLKQYLATTGMGDFSADPQIKKLASEVQATWKRDKGKAAFQKMAQTIWSKVKSGAGASSAPAAADGAPTGGAPTGGAPTGGAPTGGAPTGGAPTGGAPTGGAAAPTGSPKAAGGPDEPEAVTKGTQVLKIINTMVDRADATDLEKIVNASLGKIKKMDPEQFRNMMRLFASGSYDPLKATASAEPKKAYPLPGGSQKFNSGANVTRPGTPPAMPSGSSPTAEGRRIFKRPVR